MCIRDRRRESGESKIQLEDLDRWAKACGYRAWISAGRESPQVVGERLPEQETEDPDQIGMSIQLDFGIVEVSDDIEIERLRETVGEMSHAIQEIVKILMKFGRTPSVPIRTSLTFQGIEDEPRTEE